MKPLIYDYKIKVFQNTDAFALEEEIQKFIEEEKCDVTTLTNITGMGSPTVALMYKTYSLD